MKGKKQNWVIKQKKAVFIIFTIGLLFLAGVTVLKYTKELHTQDTGERVQQTMIPETASTPEPEKTISAILTPTAYPKPTTIPTLKPMGCYDKSHDIWHPCNSSGYITPDNEWVKYYASQLFVDKDGRIKYKNEQVEWWIQLDGTKHYTYRPFVNNYVYDWEQFGTGSQGSLANDDYWANADYYLTHGMKGDCDEWMNVVTSMMLSGEMSVWQGENLVKQVIPSKAVIGYVGSKRDGWVEYQAYGKTWITSTSRTKDGYGEEFSSTIFVEKPLEFKPVFEFTDKYFRRVQ